MKNLILGSLIAVGVSGAAGCVASNADVAHITVGWTLKSTITNATTACPAGYDTAALYTQEVDLTGTVIGAPIIDLFDCVAGSGTTAALAPAYYEEWIEIANHDNSAQYAKSKSNLDESPAHLIDVTTTDLAYNTDVLVDGGYFGFGWNLVGANTNATLSCATAGASGGVELLSTDVTNSSNAYSDIFHTCTDMEGLTSGLPSGTYTVSIDALNSAQQAVGTAPPLTNKVIRQPSALQPVTELGTINIPITGL